MDHSIVSKLMWERYSSQDLWFPLSKILSNVERDLLTTSVCPSVCGWQEVEKESFVPSLDHKVLQKWLRNLASLSDTNVLGTPWRWTTSLKNNLAMLLASSTLWHGIKYAILENRSTTTNIDSTPLEVLGSPRKNPYLYPPKGWKQHAKEYTSLQELR